MDRETRTKDHAMSFGMIPGPRPVVKLNPVTPGAYPMNVLCIIPRPNGFDSSWCDLAAGTVTGSDRRAATRAGGPLRAALQAAAGTEAPVLVAWRLPYGGSLFDGPVTVSLDMIGKLRRLRDDAPLHVPYACALLEEALALWPAAIQVACFETAIFVDLPPREQSFAIPLDLLGNRVLRRYGFHGLHHAAAAADVTRSPGLRRCAGRREIAAPLKIASICLEPQPEIAGLLGTRAVTVTGGVTPLEGLPGETTCGDIDATILLTLTRAYGWGPEGMNAILTRESGLLGLTGAPLRLPALYEPVAQENSFVKLAHDLYGYRFLQACGAVAAALGGLDALVFSGRYADLGLILGPRLAAPFACRACSEPHTPHVHICRQALPAIVAEQAATFSRTLTPRAAAA